MIGLIAIFIGAWVFCVILLPALFIRVKYGITAARREFNPPPQLAVRGDGADPYWYSPPNAPNRMRVLRWRRFWAGFRGDSV